MTQRLRFTQGQLFHMTLIERLQAILDSGVLLCDSALEGLTPPGQHIAHAHLKARRRTEPVGVPRANRWLSRSSNNAVKLSG